MTTFGTLGTLGLGAGQRHAPPRSLIHPEEKASWFVYDLTARKKLVAIS